MANQLKMAVIQSILHLHSLRWSQRRIAGELDIDPGTVRRCLSRHLGGPNAAISPTGCPEPNAATLDALPGPPVAEPDSADASENAVTPNAAISATGCPAPERAGNAAISPAGSGPFAGAVPQPSTAGRRSHCEAYLELIRAKLDQQLSAQRIFQDLRDEHGFTGGYDSVKRLVRRLAGARPLPFRRLECAPGQEAQVDFGSGARIVSPEGKRRSTHVFRIVLSHSRKAYSEVTYRQTTEDFIRALENAFWYFGGVPQTLVIDNLKAAVRQPDWFDPELVPKLQVFCQHYGTTILPTKPRMPRHKGKVESGIKYVKSNALKGRTFTSLEEQNRYLLDWEQRVADTRIHGTTKRQVQQLFADVERAALRPLPRERFVSFHEAQRSVNRDGHIEVAKAYYSVPPEYLRCTVWVRWDARLVRVFNHRFQQIALHTRHEQGRFSTQAQHVAREKISGLERGAAYLLSKVAVVGPQTRQWSEAMVVARGIEGTRVLQGLLRLTHQHSCQALEKACEIALSHAAFQLRVLRELLKRHQGKQEALPFLQEHPLIRPLDDYASVVASALVRQHEDRR
jgi:transposase